MTRSSNDVKSGGFVKKVFDVNRKKITLYRNNKAWLKHDIHTDFIKDFAAELEEKKPGKKCLLLLDNFAGHKISYDQYPNLEVRFFRANMTPFIQPLDQAFFSIVKEKFKKFRRAWLVENCPLDESDEIQKIEPPKWLVIEKIFHFLTTVPNEHIRGLWVRAKLIDQIGGEEERAVLQAQEDISDEYHVQNLVDALLPLEDQPVLPVEPASPDSLPSPPAALPSPPEAHPPPPEDLPPPPANWLAPQVEYELTPVNPAPLPRPSPTLFISPPQNFSYLRPVLLQVTPERRLEKAPKILF